MKTVIEMADEVFERMFPDGHCRETYWTATEDELKRFAEFVRADAIADEREACSRVKAAKPRKLKPVGRGMLLNEQQFCFDKGWREGAASVRAAIRARKKKS